MVKIEYCHSKWTCNSQQYVEFCTTKMNIISFHKADNDRMQNEYHFGGERLRLSLFWWAIIRKKKIEKFETKNR